MNVRLINSNKNLPTVVETFRRNVFTIRRSGGTSLQLDVPAERLYN
ncbi:MAG: hypothetical protein KME54_06840 [Tolypothrix brevis GSE-NOS-MK-07-07A]|nr:hypothetical protein [Tolypothrix brevis GSE-NOS-MK-07-07A]